MDTDKCTPPLGLCQCGCGQPTAISPQTDRKNGYLKGMPRRFIAGHQHGNPKGQAPPNPSGLCMCGCGQRTPMARQGDRRKGNVAGQPVRFMPGHNNLRRPLRERWEGKVERLSSGCWRWTGAIKKDGYGYIKREGNGMMCAHRAAYELFVGPVPPGKELDHLCRNRWCVNPGHLEPVTHYENVRRGAAPNIRLHRDGVCIRGHKQTSENIVAFRRENGSIRFRCRPCDVERGRERRLRAKGESS